MKNMVTVAQRYLNARETTRLLEEELDAGASPRRKKSQTAVMLAIAKARQEVLADILEIDDRDPQPPSEFATEPLAKVEIFPALAYGHYVVCIPANPQAIVPHYEHAFFITVEHFEQLIETGQRVLREARERANPSSIVAEQATE